MYKSIILLMMLTGLYHADLRDMLRAVRMLSRHLTGRKDVQTRFGSVPVSKLLTVGLEIFDVIRKPVWTL